jgi:uncharacterized cupredoxin-like copper-binding protein
VIRKPFLPLVAALAITGFASAAFAHGDEKHFSAGEPGKAGEKSRTVEVVMKEGDGEMSFTPNYVEVKRGEQIHFILKNQGELKHEFMLASVKENAEHGKLMEKFPEMEHDDPNGKTLEAGKSAEILWKFTKAGTFEFACLIPGHHQAGMHGLVIVK